MLTLFDVDFDVVRVVVSVVMQTLQRIVRVMDAMRTVERAGMGRRDVVFRNFVLLVVLSVTFPLVLEEKSRR